MNNYVKKYGIFTLILSSYLINIFYIKELYSIQKLLVWGCVGLYVLQNIKWILPNKGNREKIFFQNTIILFSLWIFGIVLIGLLNSPHDFSFLGNILTMICYTFFLLTLLIRINKRCTGESIFYSFMELFSIANALYVIFTLIVFLFPNLKVFIMDNIYMTEAQYLMLFKPKYYTRIGWCGFSGFTNSIKCTISVCFSLYFLFRKNKDRKGNFAYLILLAFNMLGNVFYARTGLLISLVCVLVALMYGLFNGNIIKTVKYLLLFFLIGAIGLTIIANINEAAYNWIFEVFINYHDGKGFQADSLSRLEEMYFIPSIKTLVFGDGYYSDPVTGLYYMRTDVGFMRLILFIGIFGTIYSYWLYIRNLIRLKKSMISNITNLIAMLILSFVIFEFKGEVLVIYLPISFTLLVANIMDNNRHGNVGNC